MNSTERKGRVHESRRTERRRNFTDMILYALGDSLPFCFSLVSSLCLPSLVSLSLVHILSKFHMSNIIISSTL
jgi:hypothetical protein